MHKPIMGAIYCWWWTHLQTLIPLYHGFPWVSTPLLEWHNMHNVHWLHITSAHVRCPSYYSNNSLISHISVITLRDDMLCSFHKNLNGNSGTWSSVTYCLCKMSRNCIFVPCLMKWGRGTIEFVMVCPSVRPSVRSRCQQDNSKGFHRIFNKLHNYVMYPLHRAKCLTKFTEKQVGSLQCQIAFLHMLCSSGMTSFGSRGFS